MACHRNLWRVPSSPSLSLSRRGAGLALGAAALVGFQAGARPADSGRLYTADERGASITVIDLADGRRTTLSVPIAPHNVQISGDHRLLLAVGMPAGAHGAHGDAGAGRLLAFDANAPGDPVADIQVGAHPAHVVADAAGALAYVTDSARNALVVVDLARKTVARTIAVGRTPHGLRMRPDGREIYIANMGGGDVSVVDVARGVEAARISVGRTPVQVAFLPSGALAFVSLAGEDRVGVIDVPRRLRIATIPVGRGPVQLYATPDSRTLYVANQGSAARPDNTVSVIDVLTLRVTRTLVAGRGAHGVVVSDDGSRVFVTNILDDSVTVIDTQRQEVVATLPVGRGPNGITYLGPH